MTRTLRTLFLCLAAISLGGCYQHHTVDEGDFAPNTDPVNAGDGDGDGDQGDGDGDQGDGDQGDGDDDQGDGDGDGDGPGGGKHHGGCATAPGMGGTAGGILTLAGLTVAAALTRKRRRARR